MTGSHSGQTQRVSFFLMEFTFKYMKKRNLAMDLVLGKELQPQQEGRWGVRQESFESSKKKKKKERNETLPLLPKASRKLHPSVFICIVCELPVYLLVTAASLLLWTRGNKMVIYRLLTVRLTGPERWISRNWENWQGSHCIIEKASAREGGWGRIIYIHFSRPPQERISSPGSGSV